MQVPLHLVVSLAEGAELLKDGRGNIDVIPSAAHTLVNNTSRDLLAAIMDGDLFLAIGIFVGIGRGPVRHPNRDDNIIVVMGFAAGTETLYAPVS